MRQDFVKKSSVAFKQPPQYAKTLSQSCFKIGHYCTLAKLLAVLRAWSSNCSIDTDMIRPCSKNAHKRLEAVVKANGGYIEEK